MKSFFRRKTLTVEGETITIQELSAADHVAMSEKDANPAEVVCSRCVLEWKDEKPEDIRANVPARVMNEIVGAVLDLSGIEVAKNSEATPAVDSSTN